MTTDETTDENVDENTKGTPEDVTKESAPAVEPTIEVAETTEEQAPPAEPVVEVVSQSAEEPGEKTEPEPQKMDQEKPAVGDSGEPQTATVEAKPVKSDIGSVIEGVVTAVSQQSVELDLDDGRPAIIERSEFGLHNERPDDIVSVGDKCFGVELDREHLSKRVVLSRAWALKEQAWQKAEELLESKELTKGLVTRTRGGGLEVDLGVPAFLPQSHLSLEPVTDLEGYIGQLIEFKVIEVNRDKQKLIVSRRSILNAQKRKELAEAFSNLKVGSVHKGTVDSIADYGVFVKIGDLTGLVHQTEWDWVQPKKLSKVTSVGEQVEVRIEKVNKKKRQISLSAKACRPDPWSELEIGSVHTGTVSRLVDYGAFVDVESLHGLVHISELSEYRVSHPSEVVMPGETVSVKLIEIDPKKRRVSFSIRQANEFHG